MIRLSRSQATGQARHVPAYQRDRPTACRRDNSRGQAPSTTTTIRMRASKPFQNFCVSPVATHSVRYSSDADGIIDDVDPNHVGLLACAGCERL